MGKIIKHKNACVMHTLRGILSLTAWRVCVCSGAAQSGTYIGATTMLYGLCQAGLNCLTRARTHLSLFIAGKCRDRTRHLLYLFQANVAGNVATCSAGQHGSDKFPNGLLPVSRLRAAHESHTSQRRLQHCCMRRRSVRLLHADLHTRCVGSAGASCFPFFAHKVRSRVPVPEHSRDSGHNRQDRCHTWPLPRPGAVVTIPSSSKRMSGCNGASR